MESSEELFVYQTGQEKFEDFDRRFKKLSSKIENASQLTTEFAECKTNGDCVSFVATNSLLASLIGDSFTFKIRASKSDKNSRYYRELGNQAYKLRQYPEALKQYSKSLLYAPPESEEIAIVYANRSAVFYELKKYEACLENIQVALNSGYPEKLRFKLIERSAKAKKAVGLFSEVLSLEKTWQDAVRVADINEEKRKELLKVIDLMMRESRCQEDAKKDGHLRTTLLDGGLDDINGTVPAMSSALEVKFTEEMGRHVVAKEDILPGTKLIVESPYASILLPEYHATHCSHCLKYCTVPVPCTDCSLVGYCGNTCRDLALPLHCLECRVMPSLVLLEVGKMGLLATKILIKAIVELGFNELETLLNEKSEQAEQGYDEHGVYRSDNYFPILHLIGNRDKRLRSDLFKRSVIAVVISNLLISEEAIPRDRRNLAAEIILVHLMGLPCNAHEISELTFPTPDLKSSVLEEIGAGAFATLSLLNHSCSPNVVRHNVGTSGVVTSVRTIRKGEQIFDNYGYHFAIHDVQHRQKVLNGQYFFKCTCEACTKCYPKYPDIEAVESVKLPRDSELGKRLEDVSSAFVDLLETFVTLDVDEPTLDDPVLSEIGDTACELLKLMDQAEVPYPSQMYCDAQEVLKQILSMKGNVRL